MTKPLHIGLMARGGLFWLGGAYYVRHIVHALTSLPAAERERFRLSVFTESPEQAAIFKDLRGGLEVSTLDGQAGYTLRNRVRWRAARTLSTAVNPRLEEFLASREVDFAYPVSLRRGLARRVEDAVWIPDFQHHFFPEASNPEEVRTRTEEIERFVRDSPQLVFSSENARADCHRLYPSAQGKTSVFRFRVELPNPDPARTSDTVAAYHLPSKYFIICNAFWPTKNHRLVFEALRLLQARNCRPVVVCTGNLHDYRNPGFATETLQSIQRLGVHEQVRLLGVAPREDQIQLMRAASAVIQPSLFEGWSTCVEEANCLGKPLVLSDFAVHVEQAPPGARYFARQDAHALADALEEAWERPAFTSREEHEARASYHELVLASARDFLHIAGLRA